MASKSMLQQAHSSHILFSNYMQAVISPSAQPVALPPTGGGVDPIPLQDQLGVPKPPSKTRKPRALKVDVQASQLELVTEAAFLATQILSGKGFPCAVFGSLAAKLYGAARAPKDVDILVSQEVAEPADDNNSLSAMALKELILGANPRNFYLKLPRDPTAEYRILWYRRWYRGPECKVDILVPGTMHLPRLPKESVVIINQIPLVPFGLLLLHKLQGWDDHRKAEEAFKRGKQHQDAGDVRRLLALKETGKLGGAKPWDDRGVFGEEFMALTRERVQAYCEAFPERAARWKEIGFDVVIPETKEEAEDG